MASILALRGVEKAFGDNQVLRGVDLEIADGTTTALIGTSGSGKSVLLKCAAGLVSTDAGTIAILGQDDVDDWGPLRPNIGILFQRNALFDSMNVWQNVAFALERRGMPLAEARTEAFRLLELVGLGQQAGDSAPGALSGGMRKRAALARAIAGSPRLLLLDDPTAGLDPVLASSMEQLIRYLVRQQGASALVVTADVDNLAERFDNVAILDDGKIAWCGPSRQVLSANHALLAAA